MVGLIVKKKEQMVGLKYHNSSGKSYGLYKIKLFSYKKQ